MPTDHNAQGRRPHYNRGRRGPDRRGTDRRAIQQAQEQAGRPQGGDHVDVEQIMRDIRSRIAQRHGIELSSQQVQELAARRLEAILDPRTMNPALIEQLRRGASAPPEIAPSAADAGYVFEDTTLYESHRGLLRFMRRLLNPLLKLFVNPTPVIEAFKTQTRLNREAATREAERERRQTEWNALHYDILQRLVTEVSRVSIEMQSLGLRVESLSAKVDFNDRRVRSLEITAPQSRPQPQSQPRAEQAPSPSMATPSAETGAADATGTETPAAEGIRRKRRRRRGRRSGAGGNDGTMAPAADSAPGDAADDSNEADEGDGENTPATPPVVAGFVSPPVAAPEATPPPAVAAPPPASVVPPPPATPEPVQPTPPRDEPSPSAPVDHSDPGPPDR
jgi:hypothetical protein